MLRDFLREICPFWRFSVLFVYNGVRKSGKAEIVNKSVLTSKKFSPKLKETIFTDKMGEQGPGFVGIRFCQVRIRVAHRF